MNYINIIDMDNYNIKSVMDILLLDKTTMKNIIWCTSEYKELGELYNETKPITIDLISHNLIQPRLLKSKDKQDKRTKTRAEVFTPSWICNDMINCCDNEWFGYTDVFNVSGNKTWITHNKSLNYPEGKTWKDYVVSKRMEITCGEAPYLVSRYDTSTGIYIDVDNRIGMLDRKLRVVCQNTNDEIEWMKWVVKSFQSIYGYEYQGDSILIARINLLLTFIEYLDYKWHRGPTNDELFKIANIISWNIWQMNGLNGNIPLSETKCTIYDWDMNELIYYTDLEQN